MAAATDPEPLVLSEVGGLVAGPPEASETLLFLHGWGGSKELWWGTMHRLGADCRCFALDLPGVGGTPLSPELETMADFARWVVGVCDRLGLSSVTLVGHSLGGNLAAQVALDFPSRVRRLVLVDAAMDPAHFPARARWPLSPQYGMLALRLARWSVWPLAAVGRRISPLHNGGFWIPFARRNHYYLAANTDEAMQSQLRALMSSPQEAERLAALPIPILIVHGGRDDIIPVAQARSLAASVPHAELSIFPTAHHCPMDADPPAFAQTLRDFLTRSARRATMGDAEDGLR
jgi:pimeloyl-ACP methyl ester carboxylesterase